jgi:hypothetical protein
VYGVPIKKYTQIWASFCVLALSGLKICVLGWLGWQVEVVGARWKRRLHAIQVEVVGARWELCFPYFHKVLVNWCRPVPGWETRTTHVSDVMIKTFLWLSIFTYATTYSPILNQLMISLISELKFSKFDQVNRKYTNIYNVKRICILRFENSTCTLLRLYTPHVRWNGHMRLKF